MTAAGLNFSEFGDIESRHLNDPIMRGMPSALIIDDHVVVRHGLKQMLREEFRGIAFGDAGNAVEARLALAKRPWDLVVLDIGMPGQDGFEVLREIRRNHPQMKVLVLSVHLERQYAAQSLELGAAGYVSKDASRSELLKAFRTVLAGKTVSQPIHLRRTYSEGVRLRGPSAQSAIRPRGGRNASPCHGQEKWRDRGPIEPGHQNRQHLQASYPQ